MASKNCYQGPVGLTLHHWMLFLIEVWQRGSMKREIVMKQWTRRSFLGICLGSCAGSLGLASLYAIFRYLAPRPGAATTGKVEMTVKDIVPGGAKFFQYNGNSAVIIRRRDGTLAAFSAVCTHLGCIVQWQKDKQEFLCPCHGGLYSSDGVVLAGPPPKPLPKLPLAVAGDMATVG